MQCWCARCKALVPVVHQERWVTGERGEGIVRGACARCGAATGEIGVYAAPAAERRSEHDRPQRVRVAAGPHVLTTARPARTDDGTARTY
jgi:hypothetical protein